MAESVNKSLPVKCLSGKQLVQIEADLIVILQIFYIFPEIFEHLHNFDVSPAMLRALQGSQRCCHR